MRAWSNEPPNISDDGDTISWIPIMSDEANEECKNYYESPNNYINPDGTTQIGTDDLLDVCMHTMTVDPPKEN